MENQENDAFGNKIEAPEEGTPVPQEESQTSEQNISEIDKSVVEGTSPEAIEVDEDELDNDDLVEVEELVIGTLSSGTATSIEMLPEDYEEIEVNGKKLRVSKKFYDVENAEMLSPRMKDQEGNAIPMQSLSDRDATKKGYKSKLKISLKNTNYCCYVPSVTWYYKVSVENGRKVPKIDPWFKISGTEDDLDKRLVSKITKLYIRYCIANNVAIGSVKKEDFIADLKNYKFKLCQYFTEEENKPIRLDIYQFEKKVE